MIQLFISCVVSFSCHYFYQEHSYITVLSSWDELRSNQENTLDNFVHSNNVILFSIVQINRSAECCLLSVKNSAQLITITIWSFSWFTSTFVNSRTILSDILSTTDSTTIRTKIT